MKNKEFNIYLEVTKKMIDEGIIDFGKLILKNYKLLGINETEAMVLIELNNQKKKGHTFLNPSKLVKNLSISVDELLQILDKLIKNGLIVMEIVTGTNGKETEVYHLDNVLMTIYLSYQKSIEEQLVNKPKTYGTKEEEIVDLLETEFQKQLTPTEIEIIRRWSSEERFSLLDIKKAILDAIKANKYSISYVDTLLIKRQTQQAKSQEVTYNPENAEAIKSLIETWKK